MIQVVGVSKRFGGQKVLEDVSLQINDGTVYGLVGYNGAGKTTLLKIIAGVYRPDAGQVYIGSAHNANPSLDGAQASTDNSQKPDELFIVADEPFFIPQATPDDMRRFYRGYYPSWSDKVFDRLLNLFALDSHAKVLGFSKGMQRQLGILLGFATGVRTLLLDESFDGLDLAKRKLLKELLREYATSRDAAVVLSSHNLSELEDVADHLGMIRDAHLVFDGSVESIHQAHPGESLEEIFLSEGKTTERSIDGIFE